MFGVGGLTLGLVVVGGLTKVLPLVYTRPFDSTYSARSLAELCAHCCD